MIFDFKGRKVSNSLSVFNYYKGITGRGLERDILKVQKLEAVMNSPDASEADIEAAQNAMPLDLLEVLQYIYYAMRCSAERKELDLIEVIDELDVTDLTDGALQNLITKLVEVKKKEDKRAGTRSFLKRQKK